jgi:hypothetical protein
LFSYKQLSLYQRNASLTISDMMKKNDLAYLRKIFYLSLSHYKLEESLQWASNKLGQAALSNNYKLEKEIDSTKLMAFVTKGILKKQDEFLSKLPEREQVYHRQKTVSVLPHRSSQGLTTNHYRKKFGRIAVSIYAKNKNWLRNKIIRVSRNRGINITDTELDRIAKLDQTTNELIRYEVSLWGFKTIHCDEYHALIDEIKTCIASNIDLYKKNTMLIDAYEDLTEQSSKMVPAVMYDPYFEKNEEILLLPAKHSETNSTTNSTTKKLPSSGLSKLYSGKDPPT